MRIQPECIPCILTMSIKALRKLPINENEVYKLYSDIMAISELQLPDWSRTSPDIIETVMTILSGHVGDPDPFRQEKTDLNRRVMAIYPFLKQLVDTSGDPLYTAAKIAILGNSIDFMMPGGIESLEDFIIKKIETPLSRTRFSAFEQKLQQSGQILYLGDNCGEIVCDKLFIETIKDRYDVDIVFVTRHAPTLNDATLDDARGINLDSVATVIDNGIDGPVPGTILNRCSTEMRSLINRSDLIISKGGGNFDSLSEDVHELDTCVTFMLLSKCRPINRYFNADLHQPVMAHFYTPGTAQ